MIPDLARSAPAVPTAELPFAYPDPELVPHVVLPFAHPIQASVPHKSYRGPTYLGLAGTSLIILVAICIQYVNRTIEYEYIFPPFRPGIIALEDAHDFIQQESFKTISFPKPPSPLYWIFGIASLASLIVFSGLYWSNRGTTTEP